MVAQTVVRLKVNQKIDIAVRSQCAAQNRTEYENLSGAMPLCERYDRLALLAKFVKGMDCFFCHLV